MTEDSRGPVRASSEDGDLVPGAGGDEGAGADPVDDTPGGGPQPAADPGASDQPSPGIADRLVAGFAPPDSFGRDDDIPAPPSPSTAVDQPMPAAAPPEGPPPRDSGPSLEKPPPGGPPPAAEMPADGVVPDGPVQDGPVPDAPVPPGHDPGRGPRPGFVPHGYEQAGHRQPPPPGGGYGWPPGQPPPPGAAPMGGPPPRPMAGPGGPGGPPPGPPGAPNWAPVPSMPHTASRGPGIGVFAIIALVVALVAGGVGAGVGVLATDGDESPGLSLDGGGSGAGSKVRPPDSVAGIAQRVVPSVVMIRVSSPGGEVGGGTGFVVKGGYIITNHHVIDGASAGQIEVVLNDKKTVPATVKGSDPGSDVAVLETRGASGLKAIELGNSDALAVGDPVIAIGSPLGLQGSVTTGIVSSLNRAVPIGEGTGVINAIQTDAAINPGNSGGPLVNGKGQVIGINTAIATLGQSLGGQSGSIGLGFAIPINQARRVAQEIIQTGSARTAQLGVGMDQRYPGPGVKIATEPMGGVVPIVKGSPAERAGLRPGDIITKLDGKAVASPADLAAQVRAHAPGDKITLTFQRNGQESTVEVTLAASGN